MRGKIETTIETAEDKTVGKVVVQKELSERMTTMLKTIIGGRGRDKHEQY